MTAADVESLPPLSDHARRTLLIASVAAFAVFLDTTALFVAFPDITTSFPDVAPSQLSWVLNGYTIVFAALLVPLGKLADRRGHKQMFLAGVALFTAASLLCAVAPNPVMLVAARAVQAVGGAALVPSSLALILRSTPRERIPISAAIWGATAALAGAVGPTLGAALVEWGGWRWVFVINLPVGAATIFMGRRSLHESRDPSSMLPAPLGVVTPRRRFGAADPRTRARRRLGMVVELDRGIDRGRSRRALLCSSPTRPHTPAPAMDLSLFESHNFRWANAATIVFGIAFSAMFLSSILFLTSVWNWSILEAGFGVAPGPLLVALLAPRFGKLAARDRPAAAGRHRWARVRGRRGVAAVHVRRRTCVRDRLPAVDAADRHRRCVVHPAAVERDRPVAAAQPVRRRRCGQPGAAPTRWHAGRGGHGRDHVGSDRHRRRARPVRTDLVDHRRRRGVDDGAVDPAAHGAARSDRPARARGSPLRAVVDAAAVDTASCGLVGTR